MNRYFETIKCEDFEVFYLNFHQKRIANTIGLNIDLNEYIYPPNASLLKCKIIYSDEGIISIDYSPYKKRDISKFKLIYDDEIQYIKKSTDRTCIDKLFEKKDTADEIIIIKNGLVTDTSIANIAIYDGQIWLTPKTPLLCGTTRSRLLEEKKIIPADISVEMLLKSKKIALLNAMIEMDILEDYSFLS